jgi:hypothetical protein
MAVTAKFIADFTEFNGAVGKAEVELKSFQSGAAQVEKQLKSMADSFSGRKLIQDATLAAEAVERIGGATKLTEAEIQRLAVVTGQAVEKMKALGIEVPPQIQKIATEAKTIQKQFADAGTEAKGLGGIFSSLQGPLASLAASFGVTFGVGAIVAFVKGSLDAADSLVRLHDTTDISVEALQRFQVAGDDAGNTVEEINAAIVQMENRVAGGDASAVAALTKLGIKFTEFKALSPEDQFVALSDAIRAVQDPSQQVALAMDVMGRKGAEVLPTLKRGFDDLKGAAVGMSEATVEKLDRAGDAWDAFWRKAKGVGAEAVAIGIDNISQALQVQARVLEQELATSLDRVTAKATTASKALGVLPEQFKVAGIPDDLEKIEEALTRTAEASIKLHETESTLFGRDIVERAKSYAAAIADMGGKMPPLAESQKRVADTMRDALTVMRASGEGASATATQFHNLYLESSGVAQALIAATQAMTFFAQNAPTAAEEEAEQFRRAAEEVAKFQQELYDVDKNQALVNEQIAEGKRQIDLVTAAHDAAGAAAQTSTSAAKAGYDDLTNSIRSTGAAIQALVPAAFDWAKAFQEAGFITHESLAGLGVNQSQQTRVQPRAGGGSVSAGAPYMVGEQGPELFVPSGGGSIVPNGALGGGGVVNIYVSGVIGSKVEIGDLIRTQVLSAVSRKWSAAR